jgi:hypothetical protein
VAWYFFHQEDFGEAPWIVALATSRAEVETSGSKLSTALDVDYDFPTKESVNEDAHYRGDLYMDFDGEDIRDCIDDVQALLDDLENNFGVDLNCIRIYATGGRGFHVYVPMSVFIDKVNPTGYKYLPIIYKEMASKLVRNTMDMRVYTTKRGRMMRIANVQRQNGKYKVPVSVSEIRMITPEWYDKFCSAPRPEPSHAAPTYAPKLALLFSQARDAMDRAIKSRKNKKRDSGVLAGFKDKTPPTVEKLLTGEGIKGDIGFHQIAMQLAIIAHGLGWSEDELKQKAVELCKKHQSDGSRYNSFKKRQDELGRMWWVMDGNPCYDFSTGAVIDLMEGGAPECRDLSDLEPTDMGADGTPELSITLGLSISRLGIFARTEDGKKKLCAIGIDNVKRFLDIKTSEVLGYTVDVYVDGNLLAKDKRLTMDYFKSRAAFQGFCLQFGVGSHLSDFQVSALADVMRRLAASSSEIDMIYAVTHEGLDYVRLPDGRMDVIFISRDAVHSRLKQAYVYRNAWSRTDDLVYNSDLLKSPLMVRQDGKRTEGAKYLNEEEMAIAKQFFRHLFHINTRMNVAKALGWFVSTFAAPVIRHTFNRFPHLQVYGTSGSGKTTTVNLLSRMHYFQTPPKLYAAGNSTALPFQMASTGSASHPFVLDEYKPSEMQAAITDRCRGMFRSAYDGQDTAKGNIDRDKGEGRLVSLRHQLVAPMVILAEAMEAQKAIVERCIVLPMKEVGRDEGSAHMEYCLEHPYILSAFGHSLAGDIVYRQDLDWFATQVREDSKRVREYMRGRQGDRVIFNHAVVACGLRMMQRHLQIFFGDAFNEDIEGLIQLIVAPNSAHAQTVAPEIKSELVQVLGIMSFLSRYEDVPDDTRIINGRDYLNGDTYVDIHYKKCFLKYQKHCRSHGERPLFASVEAFKAALDNFNGAVPMHNDFLSTSGHGVYRLNAHVLYEIEGIETFKE